MSTVISIILCVIVATGLAVYLSRRDRQPLWAYTASWLVAVVCGTVVSLLMACVL